MNKTKWREYIKEADDEMKESNGHIFDLSNSGKCMWCGKTSESKIICNNWFQSYMTRLEVLLVNNKEILS